MIGPSGNYFPLGQTTGTKACRVKVCGDFKLATSAVCSVALTRAGLGTGCVSDGTNSIVKAACSSYTSKESCNGGGSDGLCAFTPGSTTSPTVGTCKLMTACTDANNDSVACNAKSSVCNWQVSTSGTTTTTTCNAHTCTSKASGSICNQVPRNDSGSYSICGPAITGGCTEVAGSTILATTCQSYTLKTYTWMKLPHHVLLVSHQRIPIQQITEEQEDQPPQMETSSIHGRLIYKEKLSLTHQKKFFFFSFLFFSSFLFPISPFLFLNISD